VPVHMAVLAHLIERHGTPCGWHIDVGRALSHDPCLGGIIIDCEIDANDGIATIAGPDNTPIAEFKVPRAGGRMKLRLMET